MLLFLFSRIFLLLCYSVIVLKVLDSMILFEGIKNETLDSVIFYSIMLFNRNYALDSMYERKENFPRVN